jgi:hypothetical protein
MPLRNTFLRSNAKTKVSSFVLWHRTLNPSQALIQVCGKDPQLLPEVNLTSSDRDLLCVAYFLEMESRVSFQADKQTVWFFKLKNEKSLLPPVPFLFKTYSIHYN